MENKISPIAKLMTQHMPDGAVVVGESPHPNDISRIKYPIIKLQNGKEVMWMSGTVRSLPSNWRNDSRAIVF